MAIVCEEHGIMAEARKYKGTAERDGGGFIRPAEASGCKPHLEEVTATDDRDVMPLVEVAREVQGRVDYLQDGLSDTQEAILGELVEIACKALEPFDSKEDMGSLPQASECPDKPAITAHNDSRLQTERNRFKKERDDLLLGIAEKLDEDSRLTLSSPDETNSTRTSSGGSRLQASAELLEKDAERNERNAECWGEFCGLDPDDPVTPHIEEARQAATQQRATAAYLRGLQCNGSRLQELLEWATRERDYWSDVKRGNYRDARIAAAQKFIDRIHRLQAEREK